MIDWTINFGHVITIGAIVGGLVSAHYAQKVQLAAMRVDINNLREQQGVLNAAFEQLSSILTKVAVQDTRINRIEVDIGELRHGKGYIK